MIKSHDSTIPDVTFLWLYFHEFNLYLIIYMETSFALVLRHHSGFFQQEVRDLSTIRFSSTAELNFKVLSLRCKTDIMAGIQWRISNLFVLTYHSNEKQWMGMLTEIDFHNIITSHTQTAFMLQSCSINELWHASMHQITFLKLNCTNSRDWTIERLKYSP